MELLGVKVKTNFKVTTGTITAIGPNVIVIATGSVSPAGGHPGGTVEIATVRQVLSGEIDCSNFNKILIVDEDHSIKALSTADFLSNLDCDVELLTGCTQERKRSSVPFKWFTKESLKNPSSLDR